MLCLQLCRWWSLARWRWVSTTW